MISLVAGGCGTGSPDVHYVEGVVTLDGQPIEGVNVSFSPVDTKSGAGAVGTTDASGGFTLTTIPNGAPGAGAKAGEYLVTFSKSTSTDTSTVASTDDPNYGKEDPSGGRSAPPKAERVIPVKYENPTTSGFKASVKPGQNKGDGFKFDLKKE
jgi:hypothetical protein